MDKYARVERSPLFPVLLPINLYKKLNQLHIITRVQPTHGKGAGITLVLFY